MQVQKKYKQVFDFNNFSIAYCERNKIQKPEEKTTIQKCIELIDKQTKKIFEEYQEKKDLIRLSLSMKDPKTRKVIIENGDYTFTEENLKEMKKNIKELDEETVTIHSRILPENNSFELTALEKQAFAGFVIDEQEDEFEKQFLEQEKDGNPSK